MHTVGPPATIVDNPCVAHYRHRKRMGLLEAKPDDKAKEEIAKLRREIAYFKKQENPGKPKGEVEKSTNRKHVQKLPSKKQLAIAYHLVAEAQANFEKAKDVMSALEKEKVDVPDWLIAAVESEKSHSKAMSALKKNPTFNVKESDELLRQRNRSGQMRVERQSKKERPSEKDEQRENVFSVQEVDEGEDEDEGARVPEVEGYDDGDNDDDEDKNDGGPVCFKASMNEKYKRDILSRVLRNKKKSVVDHMIDMHMMKLSL